MLLKTAQSWMDIFIWLTSKSVMILCPSNLHYRWFIYCGHQIIFLALEIIFWLFILLLSSRKALRRGYTNTSAFPSVHPSYAFQCVNLIIKCSLANVGVRGDTTLSIALVIIDERKYQNRISSFKRVTVQILLTVSINGTPIFVYSQRKEILPERF